MGHRKLAANAEDGSLQKTQNPSNVLDFKGKWRFSSSFQYRGREVLQ